VQSGTWGRRLQLKSAWIGSVFSGTRDTLIEELLLYLCDNQSLLKAVTRRIGEGGKGSPDAECVCGEFHQILRPKQVNSSTYTSRNLKFLFFAWLVLKAQNSVVQINSLQYFISLIKNLLLPIYCLYNSSLLDPHTLILKPGLTKKCVRVCTDVLFGAALSMIPR